MVAPMKGSGVTINSLGKAHTNARMAFNMKASG